MQTTSSPVAVVGTGMMGSSFVQPLLQRGVRVIVWNRTASRCAPLVGLGAELAPSFEAAVTEASTTVVSLWEAADLLNLVEGLPSGIRLDGKCVVNTSTGSAAQIRTLEEAVMRRGASLLAASITNYPMHIGTDAALIHYAGNPQVWEQRRDMLEALAPAGSVYLGSDVGLPAVMEVPCAFSTMALGMVSFIEGAAYAASQGVPVKQVAASAVRLLRSLEFEINAMAEKISDGDFETDQSTVDNWRHSAGEFLSVVRATGQPAHLLNGLVEALDHARADGRSAQGLTALFPALRGSERHRAGEVH
ncbi:NAD(P)-binding domain-containing protein [Mycolicibacterium sp. CBMA 226]|uniref:NAD(P)-binding domain-containing protein n=1 Tax=Mycolicibacterium sp. CBMA 226 TaxID=2606611 RepID=UPI0012DCB467|nr:NAD(P)-binding domain-containing protein [Mycolicibacterium sp. CBMA 226]MUL79028.1 NAD(P)-dependent oxidoreductase [Mycolicibacterium sp. CBMA 226]QGW61350.1 2-hydroxy-3-oxopropionate reductase [Mycolicibacterium sp.]